MKVYRREPSISFTFYMEDFVMQNYQKLFIGITAICLVAVLTVSANAASPRKAAAKAKDFITRTGASLGNAIWDNKGSVAVGTVAVAAATNPGSFMSGITTILTGRPSDPSATGITSFFTSWLFYAIATVLAIIGVRCAWTYVKDYKNWLPLAIVGILLCCGDVAEAGVVSVSEVQSGGIAYRPWWDVVGFVLFVLSIFIGV
jgi:hypothetical protein